MKSSWEATAGIEAAVIGGGCVQDLFQKDYTAGTASSAVN